MCVLINVQQSVERVSIRDYYNKDIYVRNQSILMKLKYNIVLIKIFEKYYFYWQSFVLER